MVADKLGEIAARHRRTAGEAAIAWTLSNYAVTAAIVGVRNAGQVEGVKGALSWSLSPNDLAEIQDALRGLK